MADATFPPHPAPSETGTDLDQKAQENAEVITGSDYKRMVRGAYSELLLSAPDLDAMEKKLRPDGQGHLGTDIQYTMEAAVIPLEKTTEESIGGLSRLAASAAFLGARGSAGVVLASIFRGLAKGLAGRYDATSSQFGRAFQYGILYAQRALAVAQKDSNAAIVQAARTTAKTAHDAVRANLPISDILQAALKAQEREISEADLGDQMMRVFLTGCLNGLGGSFVSPQLSFIASVGARPLANSLSPLSSPPSPDIYCLNLNIMAEQYKRGQEEIIEKSLSDIASRLEITKGRKKLSVHLHTNAPGQAIERCLAWGAVDEINLCNMAEPHALPPARVSLLPVAVLAIAADPARADELQEAGAHVIITLKNGNSISVGTLVDACHSDLAASYIIIPDTPGLTLVLRQVKYLLGLRAEIVIAADEKSQLAAIRAFNPELTARANAETMRQLAE